jgi:hypothetical protein
MSEAGTTFRAPGPISAAFLEAQDDIAVLWGPVGSGKTVTALMRGLVASYFVRPERDGVRRVKGAVIRRTFRDLWATTIPSWWAWIPQSSGRWTGGKDEPATHELLLTHPDGGRVELIVEFKAFGEQRLEEALRGWEGSWAYVDECDLLDERALPWLLSRCGRYRLAQQLDAERHPPRRFVWGTCNATDTDHWLYRDMVEQPREGVKLYRLPGGLEPTAERPPGITADYYETLRRTMQPWEARRFVDALPGYSRDADPVFPEFNAAHHVAAAPLRPSPYRQLVIGIDAGGTPAATFWQRDTSGQWRGLAELVAPASGVMGPRRFGESLAQLLAEEFREIDPKSIIGVADPSAAYGADRLAGDDDWIETVARVARIRIVGAPTNKVAPRLEAIRRPLTTWIDGTTPGLILSPTIKRTRRALEADYRFRRIPVGPGQWRREDVPDKHSPNGASHVADSVQYALLHLGGYAEAKARDPRASARFAQPIVAATGFRP